MNDDWSNQFNSLLSSPLGGELLRTLEEDLKGVLLEKAGDDNTPEDARLRLLNQAGGVTKALAHLQFRAVVPIDEGSKTEKAA